ERCAMILKTQWLIKLCAVVGFIATTSNVYGQMFADEARIRGAVIDAGYRYFISAGYKLHNVSTTDNNVPYLTAACKSIKEGSTQCADVDGTWHIFSREDENGFILIQRKADFFYTTLKTGTTGVELEITGAEILCA